jgi:hypothetical protein
MLESTQYIFIVERNNPFQHTEKIVIDKKGAIPDFKKIIYSYKIIDVIYCDDENDKNYMNKNIEVSPYHTSFSIDCEIRFFKQGIRKSYFINVYPTEANFDSEKLLVFLRKIKKKQFEFVAENSYEDVSKVSEVKKLLFL